MLLTQDIPDKNLRQGENLNTNSHVEKFITGLITTIATYLEQSNFHTMSENHNPIDIDKIYRDSDSSTC
jgi:hypothetical protein